MRMDAHGMFEGGNDQTSWTGSRGMRLELLKNAVFLGFRS